MRHATIAFCLLLFAVPVNAQWRNSTDEDPITGEKTAYAISQGYASTSSMSFPYTGTTMSIGYGCSESSEWAYFVFSQSPNITNDDAQSGGYSTSISRIRWDDTVSTIRLRQDWGERFMHFRSAGPNIAKLIRHNSLLVEFDWHGQGDVHFRVPLSGSTKAIDRARDLCGIKPYLVRAAAASQRSQEESRERAARSRLSGEIRDMDRQIARAQGDLRRIDRKIRTEASQPGARFMTIVRDSLKNLREHQIAHFRAQIDSLSALLKTRKVIRSRTEYSRIINERRELGLRVAHDFPVPTSRIIEPLAKRMQARAELVISDSLYAAWGDSSKAVITRQAEVLQVKKDSLQARLDQMDDVAEKADP